LVCELGWLAARLSDCDCLSSSSVRIVAAIVLSTMPMLSVSWSRKARWISLKRSKRGQLDHGLDLALEQHRQHDDVARRRLAQARADLDVVVGHVGQQDAPFSSAHCPTSPSPSEAAWARCLRSR
jgi:hypothetical protein